MKEIMSIIASSSISMIAISGTFVVFRLQWLRAQIDDYRGRIHLLLILHKDEDEVKNLIQKIKWVVPTELLFA